MLKVRGDDMWVEYNPNPEGNKTIDCTVRAITKATGKDWEDVYIQLCLHGLVLGDMPNKNYVWGSYLKSQGFKRYIIPDECPDCYTVADFADDHPLGTFVLALSGHVVAVSQGDYYDSWDSGREIPLYYWTRSE